MCNRPRRSKRNPGRPAKYSSTAVRQPDRRVVVVDHEATTDRQQRSDPGQAGHRRRVPVTVEVSERHRLIERDRVFEQALDQLDVVVRGRQAVSRERFGDLGQELVSVAVVGLTADALGPTLHDGGVAAMDVLAVPLARRRDHPEHVVDLHRSCRLGRGHRDGRATECRARLDDDAVDPLGLDRFDGRGQRPAGRPEVAEVFLLHGPDDALDLRRRTRRRTESIGL